jgi:ABC-type sugar transport system ATPase subunit
MNLLPATEVGLDAPAGTLVGIRPQDLIVGRGPLQATVDVVETRGHDAVLHLRLADSAAAPVLAVIEGTPAAPGSRVALHWHPDRLVVFGADGQRQA